MEIWDIYDNFRHKTSRTHLRGEQMNDGDNHIVVHIWIINDQGEILIQRRAPWKEGWPNMWDCSAAGSAISGDSSIEAMVRETKEEIGVDIDLSRVEHLFTVKLKYGFDDIYLVKQNVDIKNLHLQSDEVTEAKWASIEEIKRMIENGEFIKHIYLDKLFFYCRSKINMYLASIEDADILLDLQKKVFLPTYLKYQDHETSPVKQTKERFLNRFKIGKYYKILYDDQLVGSVFIYERSPGVMRLHIINILEEYQDQKIGQFVLKRLELMYPEIVMWELETIITEERNCHFYEKMGYLKTDELKEINDKLTIIMYRKTDIEKIIQLKFI